MKKWDKIIIGLLLLISFAPYFFFKVFILEDFSRTYAVITVNGEAYKEIPLTGQVSSKEYIIQTEYGENIIIVEDESIFVREADCADQICTHFGIINQPGEMIVCLPNKLLIEIKGSQSSEQIDERVY